MVAIAIPPFDVVLRICLFPVAWLLGQRRLPVSMPRLAPMCKPRRIRRSAETCQRVPGVMQGAFTLADGIRSILPELPDGRGEAVAPQPTCGKSNKGLVLDAGEAAETGIRRTIRSRIPCLPAPAPGLLSSTPPQRRPAISAQSNAGIAQAARPCPRSIRDAARQPAATVKIASGSPGRAARRSRCIASWQ